MITKEAMNGMRQSKAEVMAQRDDLYMQARAFLAALDSIEIVYGVTQFSWLKKQDCYLRLRQSVNRISDEVEENQ